MFGALRDKLKGAIKKFTKDAEDASEVVHVKEEVKTEAKAEKIDTTPISKSEHKEDYKEKEDKITAEAPKEEKKEEKKSFFGKLKSIFSKEETLKPAETQEQAKSEQEIKKETEEKKKPEEEKEVKQKAPEKILSDTEKAKEKAKEEIEEAVKETKTDKKAASKEKTPDDEFLEEFIEDYDDKSTFGVELEEDKYIEEKPVEIKTPEVKPKKIEAMQEKKHAETKIEIKKEEKKKESVKTQDIHTETIKELKPVKLKKEEILEITEKTEDIQIEEPFEDEKEKQPKKEDAEESKQPEEKHEREQEEDKTEHIEEKQEKRSFFSRITDLVTKTTLNEKKFDELFWELEISLMENNVAVEVIEKIKLDLKSKLVGQPITRGKLEEVVIQTLVQSISGLFDVEKIDMIKLAEKKKQAGEPLVIAFVGVNGSGKTTTIAKIAKLFLNNKLRPIIAAADTFRAAAIQQLEVHSFKLGVKLIKHDYGADPAAVAFDAVKYAKQKGYEVVLIDTAGRLHSNTNLMDEMKKIIRVSKPDLKLFIGESITGNDCVEQAREFNDAIGIDGIILCKADVDDKGGAAISVSFITGKPIIYIGTGQGYDDLKEFDKSIVMNGLELKEGEFS